MKTAISLPDELFEEAELLARRLEISRSELYATALREYLARHSADRVTEQIDRVCEGLETDLGDFGREAARRRLGTVEW